MIFNTGAALLDAIVLSVVAKEEEGPYGYYKRMSVQKRMINKQMAEIEDIIVLQEMERINQKCIDQNGSITQRKLIHY